jgi:hypothetical protein
MCFSGEMSACFALISVVAAAWLYRRHGSLKFSLAILYFGSMELLQTVQYLYIAEPEDGFAMCKNPTNQFLAMLGMLHICFQPFFCNMALFSIACRKSLRFRIQSDMVQNLCLLGGVWCFSRYLLAVYWPDNPDMAARPSEACPNYEWIRDGYDAGVGWETPNLPGHSCTFRSHSKTGHLGWAVPMYQSTYFVPGVSVHSFLMFAPAMARGDLFGYFISIAMLVSGPVFAAVLTSSLSEQASIWCFFSSAQFIIMGVASLWIAAANPVSDATIVHEGGIGEEPLEYMFVPRGIEKKDRKVDLKVV